MLGVTLDARAFLERVAHELARIDPDQVKRLSDLVYDRYQQGRFVFVIGNGGSGSNASHLCEDLGKCTLRREDFDNDEKKRLKVISLTDNTPYILAWANDEGFDRVFVEQLKNLAGPGDLLVAISGSGNSPNILRAVEWANRHGLETIGCTGFGGGQLKSLARHSLHVPLDDMGIVESIHLTAFHWVIDDLHRRINGLGERS
jgi:D-sedoheptulose 7-phosphate isomerase